MVRDWTQRFGDLLLACVFLAAALVVTIGDDGLRTSEKAGSCAVALAVAVALWQRRQAPLLLAAVTLASMVARPLIPAGGEGVAYGIPAIIATYTSAAWLEGLQLRLGGALAAATALYMLF